ncbi:GIY-YIG nuclease family protein [Methylococcus sp. ANG]|uniref:GIY-YIG nuclease family protein n=1 Tax=Methylococcus sp. ANG TaxID=3231903 RepID=UPI0034588A5E
MRPIDAQAATVYQLDIVLTADRMIAVGRLGEFLFPAGRYVYTGSARRNLAARIDRHLSRDKRLRWHIDYLLMAGEAEVVGARLFEDGECAVNRVTEGVVVAPGFGASDCRSGCGSHLKYCGRSECLAVSANVHL